MKVLQSMGAETFTLIARCEHTGMLGIGLTSRSIAVGYHCPFVKPRVGAVAYQAYADPRMGQLAIKLLELGYSASKVLKEMETSDPYIEHRQIGVVDRDGNSAAFTGAKNHVWAGHIVKRGYIALGNYLAGEKTITAMVDSFEASIGTALEERLMRALEAGNEAGGQVGGQFSAAILVYDSEVFPRVDLRVDHHNDPIGELRRILEVYKPLIPYYAQRNYADPDIYGLYADWLRKHGKEEDLKRFFIHK